MCHLCDDNTLDLYVLGRLEDPRLLEHLQACPDCRKRAEEHREYVRILRQGLKEYRAKESHKKAKVVKNQDS